MSITMAGTEARPRYPFVENERPFTVEDLDLLPDDGRRHELLDGTLIVSAVPSWLHQRAVMRLTLLLGNACPPKLEVLTGPFAVNLGERTQFQPDVLVTESRHYNPRGLWVAPLLMVEILSRSTAMFDRHTKRHTGERESVPSFWLVEPSARPAEAKIEAWQLDDEGRYAQIADVTGADVFEATLPFPVRICPADLVRDP